MSCKEASRTGTFGVPGELAGQRVAVRIGLDGSLRVYHGQTVVASHRLQPAGQGWVTVPDHHARLWQSTLKVEHRPLAVYEAVT